MSQPQARDYVAVDGKKRIVAGPFKTHAEAKAHTPPDGYVGFAMEPTRAEEPGAAGLENSIHANTTHFKEGWNLKYTNPSTWEAMFRGGRGIEITQYGANRFMVRDSQLGEDITHTDTLGEAEGAAREYALKRGRSGVREAAEPAAACPGGCGPDCGCAACRAKYQPAAPTAVALCASESYPTAADASSEEKWHTYRAYQIVTVKRKKDGLYHVRVLGPKLEGGSLSARLHPKKTAEAALAEGQRFVEAIAPAAGEPVIYADESRRCRAVPSTVPLRWHRCAKADGYNAVSSLGTYQITKQKHRVSRKDGLLRLVLTLDKAPIGQFDTKAQAQNYAQHYEAIYPQALFGKVSPVGPTVDRPLPMLPPAPVPIPTPEHDDGERHRGGVADEAREVYEPAAAEASKCGAFARIARDDEAFGACKVAADKIGAIDSVEDVYKLIAGEMHTYDQEVFVIVSLDVQHRVRNHGPIRIGEGQRARIAVDPADVLRAALLAGASSYWVAHCHPSGKAKPSPQDIALTKSIEQATKPFENSLEFMGHVVIGHGEVGDATTGRVTKMKA